MGVSRRGFLRALGVGGVATTANWSFASDAYFAESQKVEKKQLIALDQNENPYGPFPSVREAMRRTLDSAGRFPNREYAALLEGIAKFHQVTPDHVLIGCGSTEILRMANLAFGGPTRNVITALPTFPLSGVLARSIGSEVIAVPLTRGHAHDLTAMRMRVNDATGLVYICTPNNPTGGLTPRKEIEAFISSLPPSVVVYIDEAYHHYAMKSDRYASFIDHPVPSNRVIVSRTFSKIYGLAGLRLGYCVAAPYLVERMRKHQLPLSVNEVAASCALVALNDVAATRAQSLRNVDDRQEYLNQANVRMIKPFDTHANFAMMNTGAPAQEMIQHFAKHNILVAGGFPKLENYIRVSFGTPEQMKEFWRVWDLAPHKMEMEM